MRTDGQTDMMKIIVTFRNFAKEPKNRGPANAVINYGFRKAAEVSCRAEFFQVTCSKALGDMQNTA
jgi:hypothetical protein